MKHILAVLAAMLLVLALPLASYAQAGEAASDSPEASYASDNQSSECTFEADNGEVQLCLPADDGSWMVIQDPASWFAISNGKDLITVTLLSDDNPTPAAAASNEWYEQIYEQNYSTDDMQFLISAYVTGKDDADSIIDSVNSMQIIPYQADSSDNGVAVDPLDSVLNSNEIALGDEEDDSDYDEQEDAENIDDDSFDLDELDIAGYCVQQDGVNIWDGPSTDSSVIGSLDYGESIMVSSIVMVDDAYTGWLCVDLGDQAGYVWGDFLSTLDPQEDFDLASLVDADNDAPDNDDLLNLPFVLYNDGWFVAKLWVGFHDTDNNRYDYYTGSVTIGNYKVLWLDIPKDFDLGWVQLFILDIDGWDDTHLFDNYENLNDPNVAGVYCFAKGTTFKPHFKSNEQFHEPV
ncbi:MAG: SH3 domain-containing protein [Coriobacteriales bacterium]|nr:SH3 domain-containing protein [Coriobacteriales bacterium]